MLTFWLGGQSYKATPVEELLEAEEPPDIVLEDGRRLCEYNRGRTPVCSKREHEKRVQPITPGMPDGPVARASHGTDGSWSEARAAPLKCDECLCVCMF